jgi:hypothetical protein
MLSLFASDPLCAQFTETLSADASAITPSESTSAEASGMSASATGVTQTTEFSLFAPYSDAVAMRRVLTYEIPDAFAPAFALDFDAEPLAQAQGAPPETQPPANPQAPTLGDLGFPADSTQGNAADQARLDKRSHMLKMHQRFGLIMLAPLIATIATSGLAGGRHPTAMGRDIHGGLGAVTADMYFMTAYYAIRAPKIPGTRPRGQIRLHKALAWIHGPGMILTPILGAMAFAQEYKGEKVHGIAKIHSDVATMTYLSLGLAVVSVSIKF